MDSMPTSASQTSKWLIPYVDQPLPFWEMLFTRYHQNIRAVYLPIPHDEIGSGRPRQPNRNVEQFLDLRLPISLLINSIVLPFAVAEVAQQILPLLEHLKARANVVEITVANLQLAGIISRELPGISIAASVLMDVYRPQQVALIEGICDILVPSSRIFRQIKLLRALKERFPGKIRLIVNEACLSDCPFRIQHFFEMSRQSLNPESLCKDLLQKNPWMRLTGAWVLPQHLKLFEGIYDELKLAGRVTLRNSDHYFRVLTAYIEKSPLLPHEIGGGPASPTIPMNIEEDFYRETLVCEQKCWSCDRCKSYWNEHCD
jgi:hypothetical protein